jgi:hypothetical protein
MLTKIAVCNDTRGFDFIDRKFKTEVEKIDRVVRQHSGWQSAHYKGKRYQVFGGVRVPFFIDLLNPISGRK